MEHRPPGTELAADTGRQMDLASYNRKRDFGQTSEPKGEPIERKGFSYVIQKHAASRLHYDFRLELDGVLLSWAVPKGPSLNPSVKRLAVQTEHHPIPYGGFEGVIPRGQYGAGTVMLWDRGSWEPEGDPRGQYEKGRLTFTLNGERLKGRWHLVRSGGQSGEKSNWLLFKSRDGIASEAAEELVERVTESVATQRSMDEIGLGKAAKKSAAAAQRTSKQRASVSKVPKPSTGTTAQKAKPKRALEAPPETFEVMRPTLVTDVPEGDDFIHEIKLDGYRIVARFALGKVQLLSRNGKDWTHRAPGIATELEKLNLESAAMDGELVVLRDDGISDFQKLQNTLSADDQAGLVYYGFDLLHFDGLDLRSQPLLDRKSKLAEILRGQKPDSIVRLSAHVEGQGRAFFESASRAGLEGVVSKRASSAYHGGRTRDWLKVKTLARQEFVIGGYTNPSGSRSHIGALLVGVWEGKTLRYAGKVGSGFSGDSLAELHAALAPLERPSPAFSDPPRGAAVRSVHWVEPVRVAEVQFTEFTGDGRLRHPVFYGLRDDKKARDVTRERPEKPVKVPEQKPAKAEKPPATSIRLTNPDRILYPEDSITKLDLFEYYQKVGSLMLPHIAARPLTVVRCPSGYQKGCFFQKHPHKGQPDAIRRVRLAGEDEDYTYIDDMDGLLGVVQMGSLELHTWGSQVPHAEEPDLLVFDLDPDEGLAFERVIAAAELLKNSFEKLDLQTFVKTTGGKGLHVVLPITRGPDWDQVKDFTQRVAEALVLFDPGSFVATVSKAKRKNKIFIDYLRNGRSATFIAPYSTRARKGAPVALPIAWDELSTLGSEPFTIRNVPARLEKLGGDPWQKLLSTKQKLSPSKLRSLPKVLT